MLDLKARAKQSGTATAVRTARESLTYGELLERCRNAFPERLLREIRDAAEAQSPERLGQGPTVALEASTDLDTTIALHALLDANITVLPLNPRLSAPEQERLVAMSHALRLRPKEGVWGVAQTRSSPAPARDGSSCAVLICTSGSTGTPKLVRLSRAALESSAAANAQHLEMSEADRWLLSLNPSHIGGFSVLTRCLYSGSAVVLSEPRFNVEQLISTVEEHGVTLLSLVPTQLVRLVAHPSLEGLSTLRAVLVGGAPCPPQLLTKARQLGIPALATFGLTEAASQVTTQPLTERTLATESFDSGRPLPGTEVRLRDGIIEVRGGTMFDGYLTADPAAAQGSGLDSDGWYRTGDLGRLTGSGRLIVEGRLDDRIITGGEKVSPLEVESQLLALPGVAEVAVLGIPDAEWGQIVAAVVVPVEPSQLTESDWPMKLTDALRPALARYKCPRRWLRLTELPRLDSGKLDRRKLREYFA